MLAFAHATLRMRIKIHCISEPIPQWQLESLTGLLGNPDRPKPLVSYLSPLSPLLPLIHPLSLNQIFQLHIFFFTWASLTHTKIYRNTNLHATYIREVYTSIDLSIYFCLLVFIYHEDI